MYSVSWLLRKKERCFGLGKAFLLALGFHILFLVLFRVIPENSHHELFPSPFTDVEIDLGEKPKIFPVLQEIALMLPQENPSSLFFTHVLSEIIREEKWNKKHVLSSQTGFSSWEILPYIPYEEDE